MNAQPGPSLISYVCKRGHPNAIKNNKGECSQCATERATTWNKDNPLRRRLLSRESARKAYAANPEKHRARTRDQYRLAKQTDLPFLLLQGVKRRCRSFGWKCGIDKGDLQIPPTCPVLGIPLWAGTNVHTDNSPTVDRFDPAKGYIKGNVRVISYRANRLKCDGAIDEFRKVIAYMEGK